jgi:hypothetical protein
MVRVVVVVRNGRVNRIVGHRGFVKSHERVDLQLFLRLELFEFRLGFLFGFGLKGRVRRSREFTVTVTISHVLRLVDNVSFFLANGSFPAAFAILGIFQSTSRQKKSK